MSSYGCLLQVFIVLCVEGTLKIRILIFAEIRPSRVTLFTMKFYVLQIPV